MRGSLPPALQEGLAEVGTGKHGSSACSPELVQAILAEIREGKTHPASEAFFFSALFLKGLHLNEAPFRDLFPDRAFEEAGILLRAILGSESVPFPVFEILESLLKGETLSTAQAETLGAFLFSSPVPPRSAAIASAALRMRHTEGPEYLGLLQAIHRSVNRSMIPSGDHAVAYLAEPFDGMNRSWLSTPLLALELARWGYQPRLSMGPSSGPKFGVNLFELHPYLEAEAWPPFFDPATLAPPLREWNGLRQAFLRRPFLATLEKFIYPEVPALFLSSSFHHGFGDKMIEIAEGAHFPLSIIVFKGLEGSLGLSLARTTVFQISAKQENGSYLRTELRLSPGDLGFEPSADEKSPPCARENARLLDSLRRGEPCGNPGFETRIRYETCAYRKVFQTALALQKGHKVSLNEIHETSLPPTHWV